LLALVALFQLVTSPIASHMVGRASFRAGQVRQDLLVVDELTNLLRQEGPQHPDQPPEQPPDHHRAD
jgi:multicomponent Na+:H+ antiporter subunit G